MTHNSIPISLRILRETIQSFSSNMGYSVPLSSLNSIFILILFFVLNNLYNSSATNPILSHSRIRCDKEDGTCYCPEDPTTLRYPNPEDPTCQTYYLCHMARAFKRKCVVRTVFHPDKGECMARERVPESICKLPIHCPPFINRYVEHPEDCTKYYLCFFQRPLLYGCPRNYFDPEKEQCIHDTVIAEECLQSSDAKHDDDLDDSVIIPQKTSIALSRVKAIFAERNITSYKHPQALPSPSEGDWLSFAYPFGKFLHGTYSSQ